MRLRGRIRKVEAATPRCDGRVRRVVVGDYQPSEADRCRLCGGCHVLVIKRVTVPPRSVCPETADGITESVNP